MITTFDIDTLELDRALCKASLYHYVRKAWPHIETAQYIDNWHIQSICEHLQALAKGEIKNLLINIPPGCSKPVYDKEWVLEKRRGRVRLRDVFVGDEVLTHRGRFRKVLAVHEQGQLPLVKITTHSGRVVRAAEDHPFLTPCGWKPAGDLVVGDVLGCVTPIRPCGSDTVTPEEARLLGYLIGDGCCKFHTANFTNADENVLADFERCATVVGFVTRRKVKPGCRACTIILLPNCGNGGRKWHESTRGPHPVWTWLEKHGLRGADSYTKVVPPAIMAASSELIAEFVGAYWSCDGYVSKRPGNTSCLIGADSVSKKLLVGVQHLLLRLGIMTRLRKKVSKIKSKRQGLTYVSWSLSCSTIDHGSLFAEVIPVEHSKRSDGLKRFRRTSFTKVLHEDKVVSVERVEKGRCRCLTVEGDSSFTANDLAVHNSLIACVFFPTWQWSQDPTKRWFFASYDQKLSSRDSVRSRILVKSKWYNQMWPGKVILTQDQNQKVYYETSAGGYRLSTTVRGHGVGEHPDFSMCFPADTLVTTSQGYLLIGEIVENKLDVSVLSVDHHGGELVWSEIMEYECNQGRVLWEVRFSDGSSLRATEEHPVYVRGRGYVPLSSLLSGDEVLYVELEMSSFRIKKKVVSSVERTIRIPEKVYNISVKGTRNYFADGVLVHNCDDPHNVRQAESEKERSSVTDWNDLTMSTRGVTRGVRRGVIMQRLHHKDLSGHLLEKGGWVHLKIPMRFDPTRKVFTPLPDRDPRKEPGELMAPEQFPEEVVAAMEKNLGSYGTAGQLQQEPSPREGGLFKEVYFHKRIRQSPYENRRIRYWDRAASLTGKRTAGTLMSTDPEGYYYVEHVHKGKWDPKERNDQIIMIARRDRTRYGPKHEPLIVVEGERGSTGKESFQYLSRKLAQELPGIRIKEDMPSQDKYTRAGPLADQFSAGNVYLVDNGHQEGTGKPDWDITDYIRELCMFPSGEYADQVDSSTGAFNLLSGRKIGKVFSIHSIGKKKDTPVLAAFSHEELIELDTDEKTLLILIHDPLQEQTIPPHHIRTLLETTHVTFAPVQPAEHQATWDQPISPYGKTCEQVMMTTDHGKKIWSFILRKRDINPKLIVFCGHQPTVLSIAQAVSDVIFIPKSMIYVAGEELNPDSTSLNKHVYDTVKISRARVVG